VTGARMAGGRVATTDAGSIEERLARAGLPALPRMAWLEIDLDALVDNYRSIARLAEGTPAWPVVKADAYGHGVLPVARALESAGAPGFCVATFDEALQLRVGGIRAAVLVLYPVPPEYGIEAARNRIAVTSGDVDLLAGLIVTMGQGDPAERLDVQLELETGLGRGGFDATEVVAAAGRIRDVPGLRLSGLWSHLTNAADAERTRAQLVRFDDAVNALRRAGHELPRHVAASGGLLTGGVAALDGVRPGLALYGLVPDELLDDAAAANRIAAAGLRPVMSLRARPVRVRDLPAGWGISYGPSFVTQRPSRIATLPLGYGDGWPRTISNRADVLVRGQRAPIVGTVAMDAVMVDVTDVGGEPITVRDEFVLLGRQGDEAISADQLAAARGTNSWEVVTAMAARLPRVYHASSGPQGLRTLVSDMGPRTRTT
jgi:alanine racemase